MPITPRDGCGSRYVNIIPSSFKIKIFSFLKAFAYNGYFFLFFLFSKTLAY